MMDFEKQILESLLEKYHSSTDKIIEEAFQEHFGFPIRDVQDIENLERISIIGDPIESFRYRGETFLYWHDDRDIKYETDKDGAKITRTIQFKKV